MTIDFDEVLRSLKEDSSKSMDFEQVKLADSDLTGLTNDQATALDKMIAMHKTFILKGYAGTGKTYLLNRFMRQCPARNIVITAPTHKAVGVANGDCTIHAFLNLKIDYEEDKQVLKQVGFFDKVPYRGMLVVDEASMISTELLDYIQKAQEVSDLYVIFIGDPAQIPPVGENVSPVWKLNAEQFMLTEIVRQARDSNIISLATAIRNGTTSYDQIDSFANGKDLIVGGMKEMRQFYEQCIDEESVAQIISYRNKTVDSSNEWGRNIVQNNPQEPYRIGEEVYIRSVGDEQIHKLEDFVVINDISEPFNYDKRRVDYKFDVIRIYVQSWRGEEDLLIPATDGDKKSFEMSKKALATRCRNKNESWGKFWKLSNDISEVKHKYGMTAHRAQGSTFENVIVNCVDIPNSRLMYTAITRASKKLFLLKY